MREEITQKIQDILANAGERELTLIYAFSNALTGGNPA